MAYTTATFARLDRNADGHSTIILVYTGNGAETPIEYAYPVDTSQTPSADYMRGLAMQRIAILNNTLNFVTGATPFIGTVLDTTTPLPTAAASVYGAYRAASAPFTPGATPQDVFTITGSATRSVRVLGLSLATVQTTAGVNAWQVLKRSTANTSGTSTTVAAVPNDRAFSAATATVRQYTANPTAGTLVGASWNGRVVSPAPASAIAASVNVCLDYLRQPIVLTGAGDVLAWNFNGVALPTGLSVQAVVSWEESA